MKKLTFTLTTAFMLFLCTPNLLKAETETNALTTSTSLPAKSTAAEARVERLNEINSMDRSSLNASEKKELRIETRAIKSEMKTENESSAQSGGGGGVYLSVGAVIIIVLLLIILL